jgi:aquaporin Z
VAYQMRLTGFGRRFFQKGFAFRAHELSHRVSFLSLLSCIRISSRMNALLAPVAESPSGSEPGLEAQGQAQQRRPCVSTLKAHWPEYLMELGELGLFMVSACVFTAILEHPASPARQLLQSDFLRRALTGLAMGLTLVLLIHTGWGKRSGAHMNPAITLMFLRLGKVQVWDGVFYILSQFVGGLAGVTLVALVFGRILAHPNVNFAATQPGVRGVTVAFAAELVISFILATTVLIASNHKKLARFTPYLAASLVVIYITFEAPFSGMSMNPARTLGSALPAHAFQAIWIYFTAPPIAMLIAGQIYLRVRSARNVFCAKLHHDNQARCIFRCRYMELQRS